MSMCMSINVYVGICLQIHIQTFNYIYTCTTHTHAYAHAHLFTKYIYRTRTHTHTYTHIYTYLIGKNLNGNNFRRLKFSSLGLPEFPHFQPTKFFHFENFLFCVLLNVIRYFKAPCSFTNSINQVFFYCISLLRK